ncbi:hypothetical protein BJ912DRAFT_1121629 [Pholiota molesta]|nr:hypothetical protein BJ912DRAFT_1121629 [Pholiota molesta]
MEALSHVLDNSPYPRLPQQLFRPLFEHLHGHRPTLFALSLCPRALRADAERALYTRLAASSAADPSLHTAFLTTVSQNRRLASYDLYVKKVKKGPLKKGKKDGKEGPVQKAPKASPNQRGARRDRPSTSTSDPDTRAKNRPHADKHVVENVNSQSTSRQRRRERSHPPQAKCDKKKAPVKETAKRPSNKRGARIDPSISPPSSSVSPSPPLKSPLPHLPAFTGFADPITVNVHHTPSPPDGSTTKVQTPIAVPIAEPHPQAARRRGIPFAM